MGGKYQQARMTRCLICSQYINLDRNSHAIVALGMHTHYVHLKVCFKYLQQAQHRVITLKEVHHAET